MNDTPPFRPAAMTFIRRTSAGRLPVALGAEAVAVRHQALAGEPGKLVHARARSSNVVVKAP